MLNIVVIILAFIVLLIALAVSVVALLEGRNAARWRHRAKTAERDAANACQVANQHIAATKHWQAEAYRAWAQLERATGKAHPAPDGVPAVTIRMPAIEPAGRKPTPPWRDQVT